LSGGRHSLAPTTLCNLRLEPSADLAQVQPNTNLRQSATSTYAVRPTSCNEAGQTGENVFEDLEGKVAVVTGGARGLGLRMARALAERGAHIALLDVLPDVEESAQALRSDFPVQSLGVRGDVTDEDSIAAAFARVEGAFGTPTILINAAGVTVWEASVDVSRKSWQRLSTSTSRAPSCAAKPWRERVWQQVAQEPY
jgi:hypothetical protein